MPSPSHRPVEDDLLRCTVKQDNGCWDFMGSLRHKRDPRYGRIRRRSHGDTYYFYAYRLSYEWFRGPIPAGLTIDHLCQRPQCVNPWHLEPVTKAENSRRMRRVALTHEECLDLLFKS